VADKITEKTFEYGVAALRYGQLSNPAMQKVVAKEIDRLKAELAAKEAEIKRLRELASSAKNLVTPKGIDWNTANNIQAMAIAALKETE